MFFRKYLRNICLKSFCWLCAIRYIDCVYTAHLLWRREWYSVYREGIFWESALNLVSVKVDSICYVWWSLYDCMYVYSGRCSLCSKPFMSGSNLMNNENKLEIRLNTKRFSLSTNSSFFIPHTISVRRRLFSSLCNETQSIW